MNKRISKDGLQENERQWAASKGISRRALSIARLIDRHCRLPGEYALKVTVPSHSRAGWRIEVIRLERIRSMGINRKGETN